MIGDLLRVDTDVDLGNLSSLNGNVSCRVVRVVVGMETSVTSISRSNNAVALFIDGDCSDFFEAVTRPFSEESLLVVRTFI